MYDLAVGVSAGWEAGGCAVREDPILLMTEIPKKPACHHQLPPAA